MNKQFLHLSFTLVITPVCCVDAKAQESDSKSLEIDYNAPLGKVTIADIKIEGADTYEDYVLIGFSGLTVGQEIVIPGNDITSSVNRFWRQGYLSDVKFL